MDNSSSIMTIGELLRNHGGEIKTGPFGTKLKAAEYTATGVPVISVGEIQPGRIVVHAKTPRVDTSVTDRMPEYLLKSGDIVFARKGSVERSAVVSSHQDGWFLGSDGIRLRLPDGCNARFFGYQISSPTTQSWLVQHATGSTMASLNQGIIERIPCWVPERAAQDRIAGILGTLDDKIELNRRMNETLETMARRLFRSWFVDFDPVRAKAVLRREHPKLSNADLSRRALPKMAPEIAEVFPDSFEDSTLGPIPHGWSTRPLYDIANFVNGAAFKNSDFCDPAIGKPVIKIAELKSGIDSQTKFSQKDIGPDREIQCGDTLYSWSGSPDTSLATFRWTGRDGLLNQHIFKVITKSRPDAIFAYYQLNDLRDTLVEIARNKQTTGLGHVTVADMKRLHVIHPAPEILEAYADKAGPIYDQSFNLSVDSLTLQKTRDKLLPRLLSGELSVSQEVA